MYAYEYRTSPLYYYYRIIDDTHTRVFIHAKDIIDECGDEEDDPTEYINIIGIFDPTYLECLSDSRHIPQRQWR